MCRNRHGDSCFSGVVSLRYDNYFCLQDNSVTALHIASKCGLIDIVRCLLLSGACPNKPNKDGVSPEIMALAEGFTPIAELLNKVKGVGSYDLPY